MVMYKYLVYFIQSYISPFSLFIYKFEQHLYINVLLKHHEGLEHHTESV